MSVKVRFAPSPTGKVHIGNIRAAIFNYLFARHEGGEFLIRVEDTDLERSTPEAIEALFQVMDWLKMDYDGEPMYQTTQCDHHLATADKLIAANHAYRFAKGEGGEAVLFRIPFDCDQFTGVKTVGTTEIELHPEGPTTIDFTGIRYHVPSKKGKPVEQEACLAGFKDLIITNAAGEPLFILNDQIEAILKGEAEFTIEAGAKMSFTRRTIGYNDLVKGELNKPLDSMKDMVIVRSDGSPVFHLGNVCDDITQGITHIVRGDDHVENTYRHLLLFQTIGGKAPEYAHLPMIVNAQGKPFSKRDGDAFVGDFRDKGYTPDCLFNYLAFLGWNPGDDREKMSREELVAAFSLDRVKSTPAQMDFTKLTHLNGLYLADQSLEQFMAGIQEALVADGFSTEIETAYLQTVCELMQSRTCLYREVSEWVYFFSDEFPTDEKAVKKQLAKGDHCALLAKAADALEANAEWSAEAIDDALKSTAVAAELGEFKLHPALRVAMTGQTKGADLKEIALTLGKETVLRRMRNASALCPA